jgi:hypothetical protein
MDCVRHHADSPLADTIWLFSMERAAMKEQTRKGKRYGRLRIPDKTGYREFPVKVLVVGLSRYLWKERGRWRTTTAERQITGHWIRGQYGNAKFPGKLVKAFFGRTPVKPTVDTEGTPQVVAELKDFWEGIAYTIFVESAVGKGASAATTWKMLCAARPAVLQLVRELDPDLVIFASKRAWSCIRNGNPEVPFRVAGQEHDATVLPRNRSRHAFATWIAHPSLRAMRPDDWHPVIVAALRRAQRLKCSRNLAPFI